MAIQTALDSISQNAGSPFGFKNRIINGGMVIDQRNAGSSGTTANSYTLDRWGYYGTQASKGTWQQNAGSVTPPAAFKNYLGFTSSSAYSVLSTDIFEFYQIIEGYNVADFGWGASGASTITLSFWVRSSLTGIFGGGLSNIDNTRNYPFTYTINSANTWEYKTIIVPGDTTGTWGSTNGRGIAVIFGLGAGSSYSGTANTWNGTTSAIVATGGTSVVGTNGATFYITGVQLEKGNQATNFDYRPYGTELSLCQRYYQKITGNSGNPYVASGWSISATAFSTYVPYANANMRASPTFSYSGASITDGANYGVAITSIGTNAYTLSGCRIDGNCSGGGMTTGRQGFMYLGTSAYISFDAEF